MDVKLGKKQKEILDFLKSEIIQKGYPPAVREICTAVNLKSTSTVHGHLERLEEKGFIRRDPTKPRAIEILEDGFYAQKESSNRIIKEIVNVPMIGKVTAGEPILAVESIEDFFPIPLDFLQTQSETYMLQVKGESMIEAGIFNGDWILVQKQNTAKNGEYVVALIGDEATVKTFYREENHIRLQPENKFLKPIILDDVTILGKVIGLFRRI